MPKPNPNRAGSAFQPPLPGLLPKIDWKPKPIGELPSWAGARRVAIDIETYDPDLRTLGPGVRRDGYIVGYSFAVEGGPAHYLPMRHQGGGNVDAAAALQYLKDRCKEFDGEIVGANFAYDLDYLLDSGVTFPKIRRFRDPVSVTEPVLNEFRRRYGIDYLADEYNLPGKDEAVLRQAADLFGVHAKGGMWRLPGQYAGAYGEQDADLPLRVLRKQERLIDDQDLWDIYNLESDLLPVLVKMRRRGVAVDFDRLDKIDRWAGEKMAAACSEIQSRTGLRLTPSDLLVTSAVVPVFNHLGIDVPMKKGRAKPTPEIQAAWLETIDDPTVKALATGRKFATLSQTFIGGVRTHAINGRIHPSFNQLKVDKEDGKGTKGTVSGRLSSDKPNFQNQPIRNEEYGYLWRGIYRPDGDRWVSADYSQQEPRIMVHFAEVCRLIGAKDVADRFRSDPNTDYHATMAEITGLPRKVAKQVFLACCYGMGDAKFCAQLGLPTQRVKTKHGRWILVAGPEGEAMRKQFDRAAPFVTQLTKLTENKALRTGYLRTLGGRVVRFPTDDLGNFMQTRIAMNRLIQGSAADQTKKAMVLCDQAGIELQIQVHDEVDFSADSEAEAQRAAEVMREALPLRVPSKVDVETGPSWGEIDDSGRAACEAFYGVAA